MGFLGLYDMAKIIRKGHQLEEQYYAIKKEQADKSAESIRKLSKVAIVFGVIYFIVVIASIVADLSWVVFIMLTVYIGTILLIAAGVCLSGSISASDSTDILVSGISGERIAAKVLAALPDGYTVFQNVMVSYGDKKSEIDNIVVGKSGVFIVEVKNHNGHIVGNLEDTYWTQYKVGRGGTPYTNEMYNPVRQVGTHIYCLANYLRQEGINTYIQGMVYFVNRTCQLNLVGNSNVFVYSSCEGKEDEICRQILSGNGNLDFRNINYICKLINQL